jgi:hypothetical protein
MITTQQQIDQAQKRITDFKQRGSPLVNPSEAKALWEAKKGMRSSFLLSGSS